MIWAFIACAAEHTGEAASDTSDSADTAENIGPADTDTPFALGDDGCPILYAQEVIPKFEVEISDEEWAGLAYDYDNWIPVRDAGGDVKPWHPLASFRYGEDEITDAQIRLKGNPCCSWDSEKYQFAIGFNVANSDHRFHGLRKIALDAPSYDPSILRERLAASWLHDAGVPAGCVNSAELWINGEYYGLYANIEYPDKEFLGRIYGENDDGNLYKYDWTYFGWDIQANDGDDDDWTDLDAVLNAPDYATVKSLFAIDEALNEWAAEAIEPAIDGYWDGSINFLLYHHPDGWRVIPWDHDYAFRGDATRDPLDRRDQYELTLALSAVLSDPEGQADFSAAVQALAPIYDGDVLSVRAATWAEQIADLAANDPHVGYSAEIRALDIQQIVEFPAQRVKFISSWAPPE